VLAVEFIIVLFTPIIAGVIPSGLSGGHYNDSEWPTIRRKRLNQIKRYGRTI
jgi:hypothetical protein